MAISFPLSTGAWAQQLKTAEVQFWKERYDEFSGTQGGEFIRSQIAFPRWKATVVLHRGLHVDIAAVQAMIEDLQEVDHDFYLYDFRKPFPRSDPMGSIVAGSSPQIHTLGSNNRSIRISGLPSTYVLSRGDYFHVNHGPYRSLFRINETVTAVSGLTPLFDIAGFFHAGISVGQAVQLRYPSTKMAIMPGSVNPGVGRTLKTEGLTFETIEVL